MGNKMIITRHPRFDEKRFEVVTKRLEEFRPELTGQKKAIAEALAYLVRRSGVSITRKRLREYLQANRKKLFPGTTHADPYRIFQIYHHDLCVMGILKRPV